MNHFGGKDKECNILFKEERELDVEITNNIFIHLIINSMIYYAGAACLYMEITPKLFIIVIFLALKSRSDRQKKSPKKKNNKIIDMKTNPLEWDPVSFRSCH